MKNEYFKKLNESIKYDAKFVNGPVHAAWFINNVSSFVAMVDEVLSEHYGSGSLMRENKISYSDQTLNEQSNDHRSIKKVFNQKILPNIYFSAFMALKKVSADSLSLNEIAKALGTKGNVTNLQGLFRVLTENNKTLVATNNLIHSYYAHPMRTNKDEYLIIHEDVEVFDTKTGLSISYPVYRAEVLKFILLQVAGDVELETRLTSAFKPINDNTFRGRDYDLHLTDVSTLARLYPGKTENYIKNEETYFPYTEEAKKGFNLDANTLANEQFVCLDLELHSELDRFKLKQMKSANGVMLPLSSAKKLFPDQAFPIMPQILTKDSAKYLNCFDINVDEIETTQQVGTQEAVKHVNTTIRMEMNHDRAKAAGIKIKIKPVTLIRGLDRLDKQYHLLYKSKHNYEIPVITSLVKGNGANGKTKTLNKKISELIESRTDLNETAFKASSMVPNHFGDIGFKNSGIFNTLDVTLFDVNEAYKEVDISSHKDGGKLLGYMSAIFNNDPSSNNGRSTMAKANMRLLEENAISAIIQDILTYTQNGPIELNLKTSKIIKKQTFNQIESDVIIPTQLEKNVNKDLSFKLQQYANWTADVVTEDSVYLPLGITEITSDGNGFVKAVSVDSVIKVKARLQDTISTKDVQDKTVSFKINDNISKAVKNIISGHTYIGRTFTPKSTLNISDVFTGIKSDIKFQKGELEYHDLNLFKHTEMEADSNFYDSDEDSTVMVNSLHFNKVRSDIRTFSEENVLNFRIIKNAVSNKPSLDYNSADLIRRIANEAVMMNGISFTNNEIKLDVEVINLEANIFGAINVVASEGNILTMIEDFHYLFLKQDEIDLIATMRHTNRVVFKPDSILSFLDTTAINIQKKFDLLYGADSDLINKLLNDTDIMVTQNYMTKALIKALNDELAEYSTMDKIYILVRLHALSTTSNSSSSDGTNPDSNFDEKDNNTSNKKVIGKDPKEEETPSETDTTVTEKSAKSVASRTKESQEPITNIDPKVELDIEQNAKLLELEKQENDKLDAEKKEDKAKKNKKSGKRNKDDGDIND